MGLLCALNTVRAVSNIFIAETNQKTQLGGKLLPLSQGIILRLKEASNIALTGSSEKEPQ